jgi:hypothetical protein
MSIATFRTEDFARGAIGCDTETAAIEIDGTVARHQRMT